ncbi:MAG TPA: ADOP family duplicated permease [Verrucomicrobiae bacterium]|nr:ADOP family duplicated permease [Verrucomicrobiae bacterium]
MSLRSTVQRFLHSFRRDSTVRDLDAELASHLQLHIDDNIAQGMSPQGARRDALLRLGGFEQTKERVRDQEILPWLASLRSDAIFGFRQLTKNQITSLAAVLSLALAIGSCTAAFRLIDAILLRPLPVANADHLYFLSRSASDPQGIPQDFDGWAYPDFQLLRDAAKGQAQLFAISYEDRSDLTFKSDQDMEKAYINYVSGDMFSAFGLTPALGRLLTPDDDSTPGAHPVAVISYDYWTRRFQNNPNVIGKTFRVGNNIFQIVGVCNAPFTGTEPGAMIEIFLPTMMHPRVTRNDSTWHRVFAIVRPGVPTEPLRAKLDSISRAFETERSKSWTNESPEEIARELNQTLHFHRAPSGASGFQQDNRTALLTLAALVFFVLLIACANVANLLVAQAATRAREMALRISIGAGRRHLLQLVLVQSAILAMVASVLGGLFASWSAPFVISRINPANDPVRLALPADFRVFLFLILLTLLVTCLFGVLPALRASSTQPASALKGGEDPHSRRRLLMYLLIGSQVGFCCLVLFIAGLFVSTFQRLSHQSVGFSPDRLLILDTVTREPVPPSTWLQVADQLRSAPGVERVSVCNDALLSGFSNNDEISINDGPPGNLTYFRNVSPGWLETLQLPLVYGRDFLPSEITPTAVKGTTNLNGAAIVNQTFARSFFHDENVVGKSFDEVFPYGARAHFQIVGVTRDAKYSSIRENTLPTAYLPFLSPDPKAWWSAEGATFIVRTSSANPLALASTLRRVVPQLRSDFRVSDVHTQTELIDRQTIRERLLATLASFFSLVALLLAAVGLYGVLHYSVQQRRREIAIRMAVGAGAPSIAKLVALPLFVTVAAGAVLGILAGVFSSHYLTDIFYQVRPTDTPMLAIPLLAIAAAAVLASLPATLRAIHTDPASTLKAE